MVALDGSPEACLLGQPSTLPPQECLWPIRADQQPEVVHTMDEFLEILQMQRHLERVVVLRNGIEMLGQTGALPEQLCQAIAGSSGVRDVLGRLGQQAASRFRARLWHYSARSKEKEVKVPKSRPPPDAVDKKSLAALKQEFMAQKSEGKIKLDAPLYISELRWQSKVSHPLNPNEWVKTATSCDIFDVAPFSKQMPLWERSEGGIFVGERGAGSGLHVDQCLWSNVGELLMQTSTCVDGLLAGHRATISLVLVCPMYRVHRHTHSDEAGTSLTCYKVHHPCLKPFMQQGRNWCGFKLFALWPWSERHRILDEAGKGAVFRPPLTKREEAFIGRAKTVALVGPGDVWVFSGGQPHTAMCVGDGVNVCAYESFIPANEEAMKLLVQSNTKSAHWRNCWMDDDDLDELYEDVVDSLQEALRDSRLNPELRHRLEVCRRVMRECEDSYCKDLWAQEDRGERRRRREDGSSDEGGSPCSEGPCKKVRSEKSPCESASVHGGVNRKPEVNSLGVLQVS
ncbi:unnamed protein product [Symbiodinium natans]|uniref:Uncharacterized protein n=1 Tax=Symbiodinium natans TaxID=878477 RepID=A0A812U8Q8_9DINO|nr:unnamed protein product [Symbiodinium natans]